MYLKEAYLGEGQESFPLDVSSNLIHARSKLMNLFLDVLKIIHFKQLVWTFRHFDLTI